MQAEEGTCSTYGEWCFVNGVCQIGFGHDANTNAPCHSKHFIVGGQTFDPPLSESDQERLLRMDIKLFSRAVISALAPSVYLSQNERDAIVSFTYNLGISYWRSGHTLFDYVNSNRKNRKVIENDFELYRQPVKLRGVLNRRYDEALMFNYGKYTHMPYPSI
jgi:GH24 family phage-related lysozyme (muramidase)